MDKRAKLVSLRQLRQRRGQPTGSNVRMLPIMAAAGCLSVIVMLLLPVVAGVTVAASVYMYYAQDLPEPGELHRESASFKTTRIYGRPVEDAVTGETRAPLLYEVFDPQGGRRTGVPIESLKAQKHVINATISIEDASFYTNPGVDIRGFARGVYLTATGQDTQGGSTITQQLVRNVLLTQQFTVERKIKEMILALEVSRRYTKDQVLEMYLNEISYGNLAYGIEAAAQTYFGVSVADLSLAQSAMLAALPRSPSYNSPFTNPREAKRQQEIVLDEMARRGYITETEAWNAKQEVLRLKVQRFDIKAPHFVFYVRDQVEDLLVRLYNITPVEAQRRIYQDGLTIYTTLDWNKQQIAESLINSQTEHMTKLREEHNANNAALASINPRTGEILALVGSIDYFDNSIDGQVNMAFSERQPGSSFKPFAYVTAFQKGWTPATMAMDVRTSFDDYPNPPYIPENVDRKWHGPVLLRQALANSMNIPAVKVTQFVGVNEVLATAHRMGISTLTREGFYGLALTLGGGEVKLLDLVYAYTGFANAGVMNGEPVPDQLRKAGYREVNPVSVLRIEDAAGAPIYEFNYPTQVRVLDPEYAFLITDILSDNNARVMTFGPDSPLKLDRPAAAKTGTTNDWRDNWTVGYTPDLVTGVWVGNANNEEMKRSYGSTAAAPIWHNYMIEALKRTPKTAFVVPENIERVEVCAASGLKPTDLCGRRYTEVFIKGTEPEMADDMHQLFRIDRVNGKLATAFTPAEDVEEKVLVVYPPGAADWIREDKIPVPPTEFSDRHGPRSSSGDLAIVFPAPYDYIGGQVPVQGNARSGNFRSYRLDFGRGMQPPAFQQIGPERFSQVSSGILEVWDTTGLEGGLYTLRLTIIEHSGNHQPLTFPVFVDNVTPTIKVTYPYTDDTFIAISEGDSDKIRIQAEATDNAQMGHVEFYMDGNQIGVSSVPPYNILWPIVLTPTEMITGLVTITKTHIITATAYDAAGNQTTSEEVLIHVAPEPPKKKAAVRRESQIAWRPADDRWIF